MAIRGVSMAEREEVILPHDPGHPENPAYKKAVKKGQTPEEPTKFYVGNLTKACRIEIGDMSASPTMKDGGVTMDMRNTKRAYTIVQRGLADWSNMLDHNGKPARFGSTTLQTANGFVKGADDETMQLLSGEDIRVLSVKILEKNGMTKQTEGNFEEPLLPSADQPFEDGPVTDAQSISNGNEDAPKLQ